MEGLIGIIVAILIGFALISGGLSTIGKDFTTGLALIVAGIVAIFYGLRTAGA